MDACLQRACLALIGLFCVLGLHLSGANAALTGKNGLIAYADGTGIVVAASDGSSPTNVTNDPTDANPSWNGEGTKIVFDRGGTTLEILTVPNPPALGGSETSPGLGTDPTFSPDGTKIAYVRGGEIYVATAAGASETNLTNSSADDKDPTWSPDGSKIAFSRKPSGGTNYSIWTMNASDGSGQTQIVSSGANDTRPNYSPTGSTIAFESDRDGTAVSGHQIYSVSAGGGSQTRLTNTADNETQPAYANDGTKIFFSRTAGADPTGIYTVPSGGGSASASPIVGGVALAPDEQPLIKPGTPFITGSANQGSTLTANTGSWTGVHITYTYQWQRCDATSFCIDVGTGATTYTLVADDVGKGIQVVVTGHNDWDAARPSSEWATATSAKTANVTGGPGPVNTVLPTITLPSGYDAPQIGFFLSATTGSWTGQGLITYTFQWTKCDDKTKNCYDIPKATSSFFTPTADLAGWDLSVTVTATNSVGSSYVRAIPTKPVTGQALYNTVSPRLAGDIYAKSQLTVTVGSWTGIAPITYTYQWKRCDVFGTLESCTAIPGATASSYILQEADVGYTIRAFVTAKNPVGSLTAFTNHTFPILPERHYAPTNSTLPLVTGTPKPGFLLRTTVGSWKGDAPFTFVYQWQRCDATGAACTLLPGQKRNRYVVRKADLGFTIRVRLTATNAYGSAVIQSSPSEAISRSPKRPRGRQIVGTAGSDYLAGGGGNDVILGLGGNDTLLGGAGSDQLDGGAGNDVIDGGNGSDRIFGGSGSDTIRAADGVKDVVDCGSGNDRAIVDAIDVVTNCESVSFVGGTAPAP